MTTSTAVSAVIYQTTDYDRFKFNKLNREIDPARVEFWKRTLTNNDLLCDNPMLIDSNDNIIDGQHRLCAAKELGITVYYQVASRATINDAPTLNSQNKGWTNVDYLTAWCNAGNTEYIRLGKIHDQYPWMQLSTLYRLLSHGTNFVGLTDAFRGGRFVITAEAYAHEVARCTQDFAQFVPFWRETTFINAIANLCDNSNYDHARMMNKMKLVGNRLVHCASGADYIKLFSSIYNYKSKTDALVVLRPLHPGSAERKVRSAQQ